MHQLRHRTFIQKLGWKEGLYDVSQMEFDRFDHPHVFYLVNVNRINIVDAVVRLTPLHNPNLLMDVFKDNLDICLPVRRPNTLEISRFCSDTFEDKDMMGKIICGLLEIGLEYNIDACVSFSDIAIRRRAMRYGWPAVPLGNPVKIAAEFAQALQHDITLETYNRVRDILGIQEKILSSFELKRCPLQKHNIVQNRLDAA